jgi:hypothetical protein
MREPSASPPIFLSAPPMLSGLRVNWTALASARYSRCRDRHRGHDQPTEECSHQAQHKHAQAHQHQAATGIIPSRRASAGREHEDAADDGQRHDPEDQSDQPDVEPHVAVEDVAELVGHHALQLVAGQVVEGALGDGDHGIARGVAGREGIDAGLLQNIDGGHRHSRREGHLLDDVEQPLLPRVGSRAGYLLTAHHQGDGLAAGSELGHLEHAGTADHKGHPRRREQEQLRVPPGHRRAGAIHAEPQQQPVHQGDQN